MKISSEFSKHALTYDTYNVIQNKVIDNLLLHVEHKPQHILDLGCGSGSLCKKINWKYRHFTGVDFAPGMLELHPKSKKIECIYGNFNDPLLFENLSAPGMLELHPKSKKIECIYGNFNDPLLFENLSTYDYDFIFSASALQWADDLDKVFANIQKLNAPIALAIFTSNTFKTLNETADVKPHHLVQL